MRDEKRSPKCTGRRDAMPRDRDRQAGREADPGRHGENILRVSDIPGPHCRLTGENGLC